MKVGDKVQYIGNQPGLEIPLGCKGVVLNIFDDMVRVDYGPGRGSWTCRSRRVQPILSVGDTIKVIAKVPNIPPSITKDCIGTIVHAGRVITIEIQCNDGMVRKLGCLKSSIRKIDPIESNHSGTKWWN